jgi:hypothetical protein
MLVLTELNDRRVLLFWVLEISSVAQFLLWLVVATKVAAMPAFFSSLTVRRSHEPQPNFSTTKDSWCDNSALCVSEPLFQTSIDVWFALSFTVAMDAFAVVFTFNRALIRKFHNTVSQRLMFLASLLSWAFWSLNGGRLSFVSRQPVLSLGLGLGLYAVLGYALDKFEKQTLSPRAISRRKTFAQYSKELGQSETSWKRSFSLSIMVGGLGLFLTRLIPSPWSAALPVIHILLEVCDFLPNLLSVT